MSLESCPDCGGKLGKSATKCRCGWVAFGESKSNPTHPNMIPCAIAGCRLAGRIWIRTIQPDQRICVNHYYRAVEADPSLGLDDTVPPRLAGNTSVKPKPVAGPE